MPYIDFREVRHIWPAGGAEAGMFKAGADIIWEGGNKSIPLPVAAFGSAYGRAWDAAAPGTVKSSFSTGSNANSVVDGGVGRWVPIFANNLAPSGTTYANQALIQTASDDHTGGRQPTLVDFKQRKGIFFPGGNTNIQFNSYCSGLGLANTAAPNDARRLTFGFQYYSRANTVGTIHGMSRIGSSSSYFYFKVDGTLHRFFYRPESTLTTVKQYTFAPNPQSPSWKIAMFELTPIVAAPGEGSFVISMNDDVPITHEDYFGTTTVDFTRISLGSTIINSSLSDPLKNGYISKFFWVNKFFTNQEKIDMMTWLDSREYMNQSWQKETY